jgi:hypothetical protein
MWEAAENQAGIFSDEDAQRVHKEWDKEYKKAWNAKFGK